MLKKQITMKKHNNLINADISKKKINQIMIKFITNIQKHESDWKKNITENENDKNVKIFNENDQFEVFLNEKFKKKNKEEKIMTMYKVIKTGLSPLYIKRKILSDGKMTVTLLNIDNNDGNKIDHDY